MSGTYSGETVYPNLYFMAVAPPANGKGVIKHARELGLKIHNELLHNSQRERKNFKREMEAYKKSNGKIKLPDEPKYRILFIPADTSTAAIMRYLYDSEGRGVLFDNEADTLSIIFKLEWGNYSVILRKGFHHEPIPSGRKNPDDYREIENPKFSVVLSGTLAQVKDILPSAENGLVSRFMFYIYSSQPKWKDASPNDKPNLTKLFKSFADKVYDAEKFVNRIPVNFKLTNDQWELHKKTFTEMLQQGFHLLNNEGASMVKRLGLITYKIAMTLTALRKFENKDEKEEITCSDQDFETAISIVKVLVKHSQFIFNIIPKAQFSGINEQQRKFYDSLPSNRMFKRELAAKIGKSQGIQDRTVTKYLTRFVEKGLLKKCKEYGFYEKI
ncbi:MAG: DUF3987 domain-containing protein [Prolixibacteraceae bacterium]|nr:DUF3987 domain-containing protein [Prolixibacteraceae bacterium]